MNQRSRLISLSLSELQQEAQAQKSKLHQLVVEWQAKCQSYRQLGDLQKEELDNELNRAKDNILQMQAKIANINAECSLAVSEKKKKSGTIKQFEGKRQNLSSVLAQQSQVLAENRQDNDKMEELIKLAREEYEFLQEQLYELDVKAENIKRYGSQTVPEGILRLHQKKEELLNTLATVNQSLKEQEESLATMVDEADIAQLRSRISDLKERRKTLEQMGRSNEDLARENGRLNLIKMEYQQNPNSEIKNLQREINEKNTKVAQIQKEHTFLHKKSNQCLQKIQVYKRYLNKDRKDANIESNDAYELKSSNTIGTQISKDDIPKKSIYDAIKKDLEEPAEREGSFDRIKKMFGKQQKEKDQLQLGSRTLRKIRRTSMVELWILNIMLGGMAWYCCRCLKK